MPDKVNSGTCAMALRNGTNVQLYTEHSPGADRMDDELAATAHQLALGLVSGVKSCLRGFHLAAPLA